MSSQQRRPLPPSSLQFSQSSNAPVEIPNSDQTDLQPSSIRTSAHMTHQARVLQFNRSISETYQNVIKIASTIELNHPHAISFMRAALNFQMSSDESEALWRKLSLALSMGKARDREEAVSLYYDLIEKEYQKILYLGTNNLLLDQNHFAFPYFQLAKLLLRQGASTEAVKVYDLLGHRSFNNQIKIRAALEKCKILENNDRPDLDVVIGIYSAAMHLLTDEDSLGPFSKRLYTGYAAALLKRDRDSDRARAEEVLEKAFDWVEQHPIKPDEKTWTSIAKSLMVIASKEGIIH